MNLVLVLSIGAAFALGVSDYLAGQYSRRYSILSLLVIAQAAGLIVVLAAIPVFPSASPTPLDILWGAIGGSAGAAGVLLLVKGFRVGLLSVVSPVSSLGAAGIPMLVGIFLGEEPTPTAITGLFAGLVAIWLIGSGTLRLRSAARDVAAGLWYGLAAGVGLAAMLLALAAARPESGIWPVLSMQAALFGVLTGALVFRRQRLVVCLGGLPGIAAIGVTGTLGMLLFLYAARAGLVSIAAVIASMSPAFTVLLARVFLGEVLSYTRIVGLLIAGAALILIGAD
jgi:drug/metabolite transporter (DMT)-like permease